MKIFKLFVFVADVTAFIFWIIGTENLKSYLAAIGFLNLVFWTLVFLLSELYNRTNGDVA